MVLMQVLLRKCLADSFGTFSGRSEREKGRDGKSGKSKIMLHFCMVSVREGALVTQPFWRKFLKAFLKAVLSVHQASFILESKLSFFVLLEPY